MNWVDIIIIIILILSFLGGLKDGVVKSFFSLVAFIIAIPLAGLSYHLMTAILSFLPGTNWENFFGFFITLGIISIILHLILFLPKKLIQAIWDATIQKIPGAFLLRLVGGALNTIGAIIGLVVFALVLSAYPIVDWLESYFSSSTVTTSLVAIFGFVQVLLPEVFRRAATMVAIMTGI
jgi:uncharacterized membrane protein required for colicin V production